jgi:hypothetical protein
MGNTRACGGADSSLFLSLDEIARPENAYDNFALMAGRAAIKIASFYDVSLSDVMAVSCTGGFCLVNCELQEVAITDHVM